MLFTKKDTRLFDIELLKILLNYRLYKFRLRRHLLVLLNNVGINSIKESYPDFYTNQNLTRFVNSFTVGGQTYYSPKDRLVNISIGEYAVLEDLYIQYSKHKYMGHIGFGPHTCN